MPRFQIERLDHVTLIVTNIEQARAFYGGVLGLKEIAPPREFDFIALWYDLGGHYLHLLLKPERDTLSTRHICFHVSDVEAARKHFQAAGITTTTTVKIAAADRFFIADPDGNRIEILHWIRPYDPAGDGFMRV